MDVQPPRDANLRNIIDKLAEFVARNGPEFEAITKQKQQNNPKFEFLYGGEFANYYQFRVAAEQTLLKQQGVPLQLPGGPAPGHFLQHPPPMQQAQPPSHYAPPNNQQQHPPAQNNLHDNAQDKMQQQQSPHLWPPNNGGSGAPPNNQPANGPPLTLTLTNQLDAIKMQQNTLREQIKQSEANLSAQHTALMSQKTKQIEETIAAAQTAQLEQLAGEQGIVLRDFDGVLQPIIDACTKDSISAGKNWILQHSTDSAKINVVLQYLLKKALVNGSTFQQKLHLIYLVNDILHHCMRKNINDLKNSLENVVIPMFCSADLIASMDQRQKLAKLLSLWESKAKFFDACVISKLQSPDSSMQEYKTNLQNSHHDIAAKFTQNTKATLDNYQKQHQIFIQHASQQIAQFESQRQQLEQQLMAAQKAQQQQQQQHQLLQQQGPGTPQKNIPSLMSHRLIMPGEHEHMNTPPPNEAPHPQAGNNIYAGANFHQQQQQQQQQPPPQQSGNHFGDPRGPNFFIPDMSKPPPGFAGPGPMHLHGQVAAALQQQQQQQYGQMPGQGVNNEPPVDLGVLNAAIQAVMQLQHQQQRHPDEPQQNPQQLQQQLPPQLQNQIPQLQQQQQPLTGYPQSLRQAPGNVDPNAVDLDALNAAIRAVITQHPDDIHADQKHHAEDGQQLHQQGDGESANAAVLAEPQIPTAPYYDLPAALMVPLIRLEDYNYKSLDPADIRVPAPTPLSERLTNALNAFYAAPSHDRPRDNEGWEKLGLYEYYKVKNGARKKKEEDIKEGIREKSRSPSPIVLEKPQPKKGNKRCYRSQSRSRSPVHTPPRRERTRSRSRSRSVERTLTPPPHRNRGQGGSGGSSRKGRNRSPRHERDNNSNSNSSGSNRENRAERNNSNSNNGNNNNSRRVERDRSPTPPSFLGSNFPKPQEFIEETNKGHQMLMKMGWAGTGTGLGSKNQGIDAPISGGEVRDRRDMYKGVGNNLNDPFESFRKNKGAAFAHRMRTRDDKS
ncbi:calcium homeostasis endoplasmic reticulum protein [Drosophila subobscura]|uniref:calcium homeostasis endoplasmic reticulum protein n=1 Tax=Drosophila subobscura TaxID=7241 RepID=UPI00155A3F12|nr:calcium homeostasis endoplasmic reticulum protein [Drosophila subobscura]